MGVAILFLGNDFEVVVELENNVVARRILSGLPSSSGASIRTGQVRLLSPGTGFVQEKEKHAFDALLTSTSSTDHLFYLPESNELCFDTLERRSLNRRILVGVIRSGSPGIHRLTRGQIIEIRRPIVNPKMDRLLRPMRRLADISLNYFSALATAITLLGAIDPLLTLARWAKWLVSNWSWLVVAFWSIPFSFFNVDVPLFIKHSLTIGLLLCWMSFSSSLFSGGGGSPDWASERRALFASSAGLAVITFIMLVPVAATSNAGFVFDANIVLGAVIISMGWVFAMLLGDSVRFSGRLWRTIFLFVTLLAFSEAEDVLVRLQSIMSIK